MKVSGSEVVFFIYKFHVEVEAWGPILLVTLEGGGQLFLVAPMLRELGVLVAPKLKGPLFLVTPKLQRNTFPSHSKGKGSIFSHRS